MLLLLLCLPFAVAEAKPSAWAEYRSAHFTLYSDRKRHEALSLLQQFERFRYAALVVTGLDPAQADEPVNVFLLRRKQDYLAVQPDERVAGFYRDGWSGPEMVVGAEARLGDVSLILFHEYVHYLIRAHSQVRYPLWYDEGFADLLAASRVADDHVLIGLAHPWRKRVLDEQGTLPLESVLHAGIAGGDDGAFYASAWLLMHYLQLGHLVGEPNFGEAIAGYLHALQGGAQSMAAFDEHFGLSAKAVQEKLSSYSQRRQWRGYKLSVPDIGLSIKQRDLDANEVAYLLGGLAYRAGQQSSALEFLKRIDASDSSVAPAFSLRAVIEGHMGRAELAQHILGFALQKNSKHSEVLTNAAHLHWDLAKAPNSNKAKYEQHLRHAHDYARKALRADSSNLEAVRVLAQVHRARGNIGAGIKLLQQQYAAKPNDVRLNLELGSFYIHAGQLQRAAPHLENVIQWDHSSSRRKKAQAMLQPITDLKSAVADDLDEVHLVPLRIAPRQQ